MIPTILDADGMAAWLIERGTPLTADEWDTASSRVGRNNQPALLFDLWWRKLLGGILGIAARDAWCAAEYPADYVEPDAWFLIFGQAGYTVDGISAILPDSPLTLYRGAPEGHRCGMSWTSDVQTAERFAFGGLRGRQAGNVWEATVEPSRLLACINDRKESEYVVRPEGLTIRAYSGR